MSDMTPDQAIETLKGLPEDRQRAILGKLSPEVKQGILSKLSAPSAPPPEGFLHSLGATFGVTPEAGEAHRKEMDEHPVKAGLEALGGPAYQVLRGLYSGFMRTTGEAGKAVDAAKEGNPASAAVHAAYAVPFVGAGLERGVEQLGPNEVVNPAEVGTALGTSIQTAPMVADPAATVAKPFTEQIGNLGKKVTEAVTNTGPRTTADLVSKVKAGNEAADAYSSVRAKIETARHNALKIGNEKYSTVNETLNPIQADPETMNGALAEALESLKGSKGEPTILKDIEKSLRTETPTYESLQGDYSRLGKELSKGTLPGDEFHAYDVLHEAIGKEMQRIADGEGMGAELKDARDYWRRMKQTFGKPLGETDAATGVLRSTAPDLAEQSTMGNRIRLLGSFDPEIPSEFARLEKAQEASKGAPKPVPGETGKINEADIRAAKAEPLRKAASSIRNLGYRLGLIWPVLDAVRDVVRGEMPSVQGTVGSGLAIAGGGHAIAGLLEKPAVVEFLTRPTDADIAQIPEDMRGNIKALVEQAQQKGIKVDPKLAVLVGASLPLRGPKTKKLQDDANFYRTNPR